MSAVFMFLCRQQKPPAEQKQNTGKKNPTNSLLLGMCYLYLKDSRLLTFCVLFKLCWEDKKH